MIFDYFSQVEFKRQKMVTVSVISQVELNMSRRNILDKNKILFFIFLSSRWTYFSTPLLLSKFTCLIKHLNNYNLHI